MAEESRLFFDVFKTVNVNSELRLMFEKTEVKKVRMSPQGDALTVCILSDHIIHYHMIKKMTSAIKNSLFKDSDTEVRILQRYELSDAYNLKTVMDVYKDSVFEEIKDKDHILGSALKQADIVFADDKTMNLTLADSRTSRSLESKLREILEKIFTDRCGVDCILNIDYKEKGESALKASSDAMIERRIAEISARAGIKTEYTREETYAGAAQDIVPDVPAQTESPATASSKSEGRSDDSGKSKGFKRRALK